MDNLTFACPNCAETEHLRGEAVPEDDKARRLTCETCGHSWVRGRFICPQCGSRSVWDEKRPVYTKSRGVQQSIIGEYAVQHCDACGWTSASGDKAPGYTADDK